MRHVIFLNESLVSCIKENERVVSQGVIHPLLKLFFGERSPRRIVGITEIDDINPLVGDGGDELVFCRARHVSHVTPLPIGFEHPSPSTHHVAVDIYRIDRIGHTHTIVVAQNIADVTSIALCPVVHEDFARREMNTP